MGKVRQRKNASSSRGGQTPSSKSKPTFIVANNAAAPNSSGPGIFSLLIYLLRVLLLASLSVPFWLPTAILSLIYGKPPKMVSASQTRRFLRYSIECKDLSVSSRIDLMLTIILHTATSPVSGFCWLLDDMIYGRQLNSVAVVKPLFVLSAYRSASTEMARTLAKDTNRFVAPSAIMCAFPYLWLWRVVMWIVGDDSGISIDEFNGYLNKGFPKESLERHDNNHFAIDTFDGYFFSSHLNGLAFQLGAEVIVKELNTAKFEERNRYLFEHCFVEHVDRIARKTLLFNNVTSASSEDRTLLLKGHFLMSAPALQRKYPDARFLAVLRDPIDRLQSGINHLAVNSTIWRGKPPRWDWISESYQQIEVEYCQREMDWYNAGGNDDGRLAVTFDAFIKDFDKTINRIYRDLLKKENAPTFVPPLKVSKRYTVNRSLKDLGVDEAGLKRQLVEYYAWMKKQ